MTLLALANLFAGAIAIDLVNRDFYVIGYRANSGGRSLYRVPLNHSTGRANVFGHIGAFPAAPISAAVSTSGISGVAMRYLGDGEGLMAGNCGAANYAEDAPGVGAGMTDHCKPGSIQRYPAAGSGRIVVVPPTISSSTSRACPPYSTLSPVLGQCGANAVPSPVDRDRKIFYDFDHRLGWPDRGGSELREMSGPGEIAWCGMQPGCCKLDDDIGFKENCFGIAPF